MRRHRSFETIRKCANRELLAQINCSMSERAPRHTFGSVYSVFAEIENAPVSLWCFVAAKDSTALILGHETSEMVHAS